MVAVRGHAGDVEDPGAHLGHGHADHPGGDLPGYRPDLPLERTHAGFARVLSDHTSHCLIGDLDVLRLEAVLFASAALAGSSSPKLDAQLVLATVRGIEIASLAAPSQPPERETVFALFERLLTQLAS